MGALKLEKFLGQAPRIASELLPETAAGYAYNTKLYAGNLIPYNISSVQLTMPKGTGVKTIYPMDDGSGGFKWLHWLTDVDIARVSALNDTTQRIYYTGDSEPRVTNYSLATASGSDFPYSYYTLGLPIPLTAPTVAAVSFTAKASTFRARDAGGTATITTGVAHGLLSGTYVTTTGFGGVGYNLSNTQVTVTGATTFTYYSPGAAEAPAADVGGVVNLSGPTKTRTYVYTWLTAWDEESIPSPVSTTLYLKDGQTVNISALPAAWPHGGTYQTTGMVMRIYRTVTSASGTLYYKVTDITLGAGTTYTDTVQDNVLVTPLPSLYYDQPSSSMIGGRAAHNGMMVGFYGNTVGSRAPSMPHAWPIKYRQQVDEDIVAINNVGQVIVVLTKKNPWVFQGAAPSLMSKTRMDYTLTCTSKRGVVNMGFGLVFPTPGGLAIYSSATGGELLTKMVHDWDTWKSSGDYTTIVAKQYNGKYLASHSRGSFLFERNDQVGGFLVDLLQPMTSMYYDQLTPNFYYTYGAYLSKWDADTQVLGQFDWKSKTLITKDYMNLGAARVIADYGDNANDTAIAAANAAILVANAAEITNKTTGGSIGGESFGGMGVATDTLQPLGAIGAGVQFQLYVDKKLIFTQQVLSNDIFRLPTGYRSDTFEVRLTGNVRVRAVHLGETPFGLKKA